MAASKELKNNLAPVQTRSFVKNLVLLFKFSMVEPPARKRRITCKEKVSDGTVCKFKVVFGGFHCRIEPTQKTQNDMYKTNVVFVLERNPEWMFFGKYRLPFPSSFFLLIK
jgi:hypothetical protein